MELRMIGLGRMGANMAARLLMGGHRVVGYDPRAEKAQRLAERGVAEADSLGTSERAAWAGRPGDDVGKGR